MVVTDLHVTPRRLASLRQVSSRLSGTCDAVLAGDHGGARNDFAPSFLAVEMLACGLRPWITLSCRDRNRVALGAELASLAELGIEGVHCVTGDWEGLAGSAGESKVFDLDCLRLVDMARNVGLNVSVAAAPASPPLRQRPARLAQKVAAGAQMCFVNHCGGPGAVGAFAAAARDAGADIPIVACVAVAADATSVTALRTLPGTLVDEAAVGEAGRLDPDHAVSAAVSACQAMMAVPGVSGVNLSGSASSRSDDESARIMGAIGSRLRDALSPSTHRGSL